MAMVRRGGSKYHARKTTVDGITFDSKKEAKRWCELKLMERSGVIRDLQRQVRFELVPAFDAGGRHYRATTYVADFVYYDVEAGRTVYEDVKGYRTDVYRLKAKLFAYRFHVPITET